MSLVHARSWNSWNSTSSSLTYGSQWKASASSPLSYSWTPDAASTTPVKHSVSSWTGRQHDQKPSFIICAVCRRPKCHLRSHEAYLSPGNAKSKYTVHHPGIIDRSQYDAKPTTVNDSIIRTAFTKSYAFVEPSCLSTLQPSSFRLDVFHDLPIMGGDRPETHKVIWEFLAHQLRTLFEEHLRREVTIDHLQRSCLESVMTDPIVCLCIFATERILRLRVPGLIRDEHTATSIRASERYLEWLRHRYTSRDEEENTSNQIISMCLRLVQPSDITLHWPYGQLHLLPLPEETMDLNQNDHFFGDSGPLTFDRAVAR